MPDSTTSVLIPSFKRGERLRTCLMALGKQTVLPGEVIVAWQGDDTATRDLVESCRADVAFPLIALHAPQGIVPAENAALAVAKGQIILLIDDDAIAPPDWLAKHVAFYDRNPRCGAVGGPAYNYSNGVPLPRRTNEPTGVLTWYGKHVGNMYDHIDAWRDRPPQRVDHLVGYNMSLRRSAFDRFEERLLPYWQLFEQDACLQVAGNGFEVWFDFSNVVEHHHTSAAYMPGRDDNLDIKIFNLAYNDAFILSKYSPPMLRIPRMLYMLLLGGTRSPGIAAMLYAMYRFGSPRREWMIWRRTLRSRRAGWRDGKAARPTTSASR